MGGFSSKELIQLEKNVIDNDPNMVYGNSKYSSIEQLYQNFAKYLNKKGIQPNNKLEDVFPILLYKNHYRDDYYSKTANNVLPHSDEHYLSLKKYFVEWLEFALDGIPAYNGQVSHSIKFDCIKPSCELAMEFKNNTGSKIKFRKFLSTSYLRRECNFRFDIITLPENSSGKKVFDILDEEPEEGEREILFNINTTFKILGVKKVNNIWVVDLEEVIADLFSTNLEYDSNHIQDITR